MAPGTHDPKGAPGDDHEDLEERPRDSLVERLQAVQARIDAALPGRSQLHADSSTTLSGLITQLEASADALLEEHRQEREKTERMNHQFGELVELVMALAALDYSQRATVYEGQDDATNALAVGLNMMCEELEHATTELIHARDTALAANRAKSTFLAHMSHEFRTPLNAIIGYSELLCEEHGATADRMMLADLERINTAARHLLDLIQDTLDISKIEADKIVLEFLPVDLHELLEDILSTIEPTLHKQGNHLEYVAHFELKTMLGDSTRLRQVLLNLLSNASKFTREGVVTLTVHERTEAGLQTIDFAVSDTGIGIKSSMLNNIFEAFSQADDSTTRLYGGTGLGLTISRRLCTMMGGSLSVTSEVGVGSTFVASLPTRPPTNL